MSDRGKQGALYRVERESHGPKDHAIFCVQLQQFLTFSTYISGSDKPEVTPMGHLQLGDRHLPPGFELLCIT